MSKKVISFGVLTVLSLGMIGGFIFWRTEKLIGCDELLKNKSANHACISTNYGSMVFELYVDAAPKSIERFKSLSNEHKFYNGLEFYRVIKDFVVQGGIQDLELRNTNTENNDESYKAKLALREVKIDTESNFDLLGLTDEEKATLAEEGFKSDASLKTKPFEYGTLSFANAGAGTNSTEFFVVTDKKADSTSLKTLNGRFTNMGKIISGTEVLDKMNSAEIDQDYAYANGESEKPIKIIEIKEILVK